KTERIMQRLSIMRIRKSRKRADYLHAVNRSHQRAGWSSFRHLPLGSMEKCNETCAPAINMGAPHPARHFDERFGTIELPGGLSAQPVFAAALLDADDLHGSSVRSS